VNGKRKMQGGGERYAVLTTRVFSVPKKGSKWQEKKKTDNDHQQ
jgi:hypothetical protein